MLVAGGSPWVVIGIATAGNFIGGLTSYGVGRIGKWEWIEKLGVKPETLEKQKAKVDKHGAWVALLSWVPFVGDVFAVVLGFYKARFLPSALWMLVGKGGRFVVWALIFAQI
jgi:membrane protein YqaA with SNARE-associated domain